MPDGVQTTPPTAARDVQSQEVHDTRDLAGFGYRQELRRVLGVYSSFAVAFSYISPSTGIFTLYALGLGIAGGFFFWSWPIVAIGQFLVALNFAEVSSHFPLAGSVYQWSKYLSNRHYSWFTGWIYLFAGILTVTAVDVTVPIVLVPFLNGLGMHIPAGTDPGALQAAVTIGALVLVSTTLLNIFGVRLVSLVNNTGVVFEILGMVVLALVLLIFFHHQSPGILFNTSYLGSGFTNSAGTFLAAMFMSLFVIYGFDTASTLAEETRNPRREAPRAVLASIAGAFVIGTIFLLATILAIPGDANKFISDTANLKAFPPVDIITGNFGVGSFGSELYLFIVFAAVYVCCLAIQTSTIRLAFGMARDRKLPFGSIYNRVSPTLHTPIGTCIVIGALSAIPLFYYAGAGIIAIAATGMIYLSYFLGNLSILLARLRGWPTQAVPFKLGSWGPVVNVLALLWGGSMLINFLWPRPASNPALNSLPNFPGFLAFGGNVPIFEATLGVILVVGAVYYLVAQRNRPAEPLPAEAARASA
ncbi:MAG TPA: amino acid permease [Candidatus Limnocylindrales bacterium]|nr:amino acid permease [Candidatus Limnocylindrales bacterium]